MLGAYSLHPDNPPLRARKPTTIRLPFSRQTPSPNRQNPHPCRARSPIQGPAPASATTAALLLGPFVQCLCSPLIILPLPNWAQRIAIQLINKAGASPGQLPPGVEKLLVSFLREQFAQCVKITASQRLESVQLPTVVQLCVQPQAPTRRVVHGVQQLLNSFRSCKVTRNHAWVLQGLGRGVGGRRGALVRGWRRGAVSSWQTRAGRESRETGE